jgi:hypothetical protein
MKFVLKALIVPLCVLVLAGCMPINVVSDSQTASGAALDALNVDLPIIDQSNREPACSSTWQWPSRFGDIQFQECERGSRYFVQLTDQVFDEQNIDTATISWSWHNCNDATVYLRGTTREFLVNPPHITTCGNGGYYLLLVYRDNDGLRWWDSVWFKPGVYHH